MDKGQLTKEQENVKRVAQWLEIQLWKHQTRVLAIAWEIIAQFYGKRPGDIREDWSLKGFAGQERKIIKEIEDEVKKQLNVDLALERNISFNYLNAANGSYVGTVKEFMNWLKDQL